MYGKISACLINNLVSWNVRPLDLLIVNYFWCNELMVNELIWFCMVFVVIWLLYRYVNAYMYIYFKTHLITKRLRNVNFSIYFTYIEVIAALISHLWEVLVYYANKQKKLWSVVNVITVKILNKIISACAWTNNLSLLFASLLSFLMKI